MAYVSRLDLPGQTFPETFRFRQARVYLTPPPGCLKGSLDQNSIPLSTQCPVPTEIRDSSQSRVVLVAV